MRSFKAGKGIRSLLYHEDSVRATRFCLTSVAISHWTTTLTG